MTVDVSNVDRSTVDLSCQGVSKRYRIRQQDAVAGRGWISRLQSKFLSRKDFWALREIGFEVPSGQALGVIGHNGAGKSTLLKLLSGITAPTTGEISVRGRLAALLEVGSGFHPELTGRENVFLSGSILGMTRREIRSKLERIIDFADIRPFIDVPVKRYSSGMYVRLGFSIAAHLEPDILLLDEVLAVGDAAFQSKCTERIRELKRGGTTIVFISHDLAAVERMCDRVLVMDHGQVTYDGQPADAIAAYNHTGKFTRALSKVSTRVIEITGLECLDEHGAAVGSFETGQGLRIRVEYLCHKPVPGARIDLYFNTNQGLWCTFGTRFSPEPLNLDVGPGVVEFHAEQLALSPNLYRIDAIVEQHGAPDPLEWLEGCAMLNVNGGQPIRGGIFYHPNSWRLLEGNEIGRASNARRLVSR